MTTPAFTATPAYTVSGTGPYTIVHPYFAGAIIAAVVDAEGVRTALAAGVDFTLSPASSETTGTLTLSAGAAAAHAGKTLFITRYQSPEQGFQGQTAREVGMEAVLDWITQAVQDLFAVAGKTLRLDSDVAIGSLAEGRLLIGTANGFEPGPDASDIADAQANAAAAAASATAAGEAKTDAEAAQVAAEAAQGGAQDAETGALAAAETAIAAATDDDPDFTVNPTLLAPRSAIKTAIDSRGSGPAAFMREVKSTGADGGTATSGTWITRELDNPVLNIGSVIALASNEFTPAVDGWVEWSAPAYRVGEHLTRLFCVTDAAVVDHGSSEVSETSGGTTSRSVGSGAVEAGKAYRIEHRVQTTRADDGFGKGTGMGTPLSAHERFTMVTFWRGA